MSNLEIYFIIFSGSLILTMLSFFIYFLVKKNFQNIRKNLDEKQLLQSQHQQQLLQTQLEIQEQTFKNISEEIHDNVGQVLSVIHINIHTLENLEEKKFEDIKQQLDKVIYDLRNLSRSLHGDRIARQDLEEAIEDELRFIQNSGLFITSLKVSGQKYSLSPQQKIVIFRILQEVLHNTLKHAKAHKINVMMEYGVQQFILSVSDDGIGFAKAGGPGNGIGLNSMQNRAALIGALVEVFSEPGDGTKVFVKLPIS